MRNRSWCIRADSNGYSTRSQRVPSTGWGTDACLANRGGIEPPSTRLKRPPLNRSATGSDKSCASAKRHSRYFARLGLDAVEELKYPLGEQRGRIGVVRWERAVGKVMLVTGVQEKLRVLDVLHDLAGGVDVTLADEDRVVVHAVDLNRDTVRP